MDASKWPIVILESPFAGDTEINMKYLFRCVLDCIARKEVPYASHRFWPGILNDDNPDDRETGITAGYAFWDHATKIVFYLDRGMSSGMERAMARAHCEGKLIEERWLDQRSNGD